MKCKTCGFENIETAKFCCQCGEKLEEMKCCTNPDCENFNRYMIPVEASFCPVCGKKIEIKLDAPFHERYPEYDLIPYAEFRYKDNISFFFNKPEYIEDASRHEGKNYFFIAREEKFGVLRYEYHEHWYGDEHFTHRIIPCEYDKIERMDDYFICYKNREKFFIDYDGKIIK